MKDADNNVFEFIDPTDPKSVVISVKLNGKKVGEIRPINGGYHYLPAGGRHGSDVLPSVDAVKKSIMEEVP